MSDNERGATFTRASQVIHDLKHSNYFRIWAMLWLTIFIIFWIGMVTGWFARTSDLYATGFQPQTQLAYPYFHYRLEGMQNGTMAINWNSVSCKWNQTLTLAYESCLGYPVPVNGLANCFSVVTHNATFTAYGRPHADPKDLFSPTHFSSMIWCNFSVNLAALGTTPNWVAWDIDCLTRLQSLLDYNYGDNSAAPTYFPSFTVSQILLESFTIAGTQYWEHNHVYLPAPVGFNSTADGLNAQYITSVALATTTVSTYSQFTMYYKSWNALADIGGLAFGLWIMHTVAMIIVGMFLANDSKFLTNAHEHHHDHHDHTAKPQPTENTALVY